MKEENNESAKIESFPNDDNLYVVTNYGGFVKNYNFSIDIPLVNVTLSLVENGKLVMNVLSCIVGLPELSLVRIGTIWKNQVRQENYWKKYKNYKEYERPLIFDLESFPAECVLYKKDDLFDKSNYEGISFDSLSNSDIFKLSKNKEFYGSSFVKFTDDKGIKYIVPSIELLMSTYLPRNKLIRNEIVLKPINSVLDKYIKDYESTSSEYFIKIDKCLEKETVAFLAYAMCNKKARTNISKLWTSLESSFSSNLRHPFILPYHPKIISFNVSGMWINKQLFYIQRIYKPEAPSEIRIKGKCNKTISFNEKVDEAKIQDLDATDSKKRPLNNNIVNETLNVTPRNNPSGNAGVKYIVSEVSPNNDNLYCEIEEDVTVVNGNDKNYIKDDNEVNGASSGRFSERKDSINIARTEYIIEENPDKVDFIREVIDAFETLIINNEIKKLVYVDDRVLEHENLIYASFNSHHINLNENKYWASGYTKSSGIKKSESGYRKLLIVNFEIEGKQPLYLLEIIKKVESDSFYGVIFQLEEKLTFSKLEEIKYIIASNKGHFKGKDIYPFPVNKMALYRHTWGKMVQRFRNIIELINEKDIFD